MSRDPLLYLEDILSACERIAQYVHAVDYEQFVAESMRLDATVRNLTIIGEAAQRLPDDIRARIGAVPWREIIGMRNVLIHAYFGIDSQIVWSAATEKIGPLAVSVREYLANASGQDRK